MQIILKMNPTILLYEIIIYLIGCTCSTNEVVQFHVNASLDELKTPSSCY